MIQKSIKPHEEISGEISGATQRETHISNSEKASEMNLGTRSRINPECNFWKFPVTNLRRSSENNSKINIKVSLEQNLGDPVEKP